MRKRLNLCKTIVGIVKNSVGVVDRVKLFLLALFFLFHTTTFAYFPICCGCFLAFWWSRTPLFYFWLFLGYILVFLIHYVSYFPCFLVVSYPDISFFAFFGVHSLLSHTLCFIFSLLFSGFVPRYFIFYISRGTLLLVHHLLWFQHTPIHRKRTPTFYF